MYTQVVQSASITALCLTGLSLLHGGSLKDIAEGLLVFILAFAMAVLFARAGDAE